LGLEAGIIYFGANYQQQPRKFKGAVIQSLTIPCVFGSLLAAAVWFMAPTLADQVFHKPDAAAVIRLFGLALPFYTVCFVAGGITKLSQRMQYFVYSGLAQASSALGLFCILFFFGWGLPGAIVATLSGFAVGASLSVYYVRRLFPVIGARHIRPSWLGRELLTYSGSVMLAGIGYNGLLFVDRLFVAAFRSATDTGIYQAASQLAIMFAILLGSFHGIFRPMVADIYALGDRKRLAELYRLCTKWTLYACLPLFLLVVTVPASLLEFVYGSSYSPAATPLIVLSISQLVTVVTAGSHTMLIMTGRQRTFVVAALACVVADLLLSRVLVPEFGLNGAAIATAASNGALNLISVLAVKRYLGIWPIDGRFVKSGIAAAVTFGALLTTRTFDLDTPALKLFVVGCVSVIVFIGSLAAIGLDTEDWQLLRMARDCSLLRRLWPVTIG
jgi:O-antigen/teichoic acid export membrane protein